MTKEEAYQLALEGNAHKSIHEIYHIAMELYAQQVAKESAAYAWDAAMRYINDDSDFLMGEGKKKYPSKTEYINQKFPTNPNK